MADLTVAPETTESQRLYAAWRCARAEWELALYSPANSSGSIPEDAEDAYCSADNAALIAYLMAPAEDIGELARKLRVLRDEDGSGLSNAAEVIAALASSAQKLATREELRLAKESRTLA